MGPTQARANSYDREWKAAWVDRARSLVPASGKTDGFVLQIGDSITHSVAYAAWPMFGQGKSADDAATLAWARASGWGAGNHDASSKNGWYLAAADTTAQRGMTASGGLSIAEIMSGCCNGGPDMPALADPVAARQTLIDVLFDGNLQVDTVLSAFSDAQFAVVMLGTNDPSHPDALAQLTAIVDKLEARQIVPILSTIPPRSDSVSSSVVLAFNAAVAELARARSLPLIDFHREILLRRPGTSWAGTLISDDGVHPTSSGEAFSTMSDPYLPGGDPGTHTTGDALLHVGYLLRSWLTVQKLQEIKRHVIDRVDLP
jgi:hypothetical protein